LPVMKILHIFTIYIKTRGFIIHMQFMSNVQSSLDFKKD
jgi:hypothetical protein